MPIIWRQPKALSPAACSADLDDSAGAPIEIRHVAVRRLIAPWVMAAPFAQLGTVGGGFARRGHFPFRFFGQPSARPIAKRLGFIPADVNHRQVFIEQNIAVVNSLLPAAVVEGMPIDRVIESSL